MTQKKHLMFWTTVRSLSVAKSVQSMPKKMVILRPQALISANWNSWQFKGENGANMWYSIRIRGIPLSGFRVGFSHFQSDTMLPHSQSSVPSLPPVGIHLPLHSQNGSDLTIQEKRWTWKKKDQWRIKWETCVFLNPYQHHGCEVLYPIKL